MRSIPTFHCRHLRQRRRPSQQRALLVTLLKLFLRERAKHPVTSDHIVRDAAVDHFRATGKSLMLAFFLRLPGNHVNTSFIFILILSSTPINHICANTMLPFRLLTHARGGYRSY